MAINLNPYISFKDDARQAMEFYKSIFGGELQTSTFKEFGVSEDPAEADKIMHSQLQTANGLVFMAGDTPSSIEYRPGARISMSLSGDDDTELSRYFDKLSDGGTVQVPLEQAPWGVKFGMVTDEFGVDWKVNVAGQAQS